MSSIQFQNLLTAFSVKCDSDYPRVFENVNLKVTDMKLGRLASLSAVKIDRSGCRGSFLHTLDDHSEDLCHFSVELFDNHGRVHPWLIESGSRSGTGAWGKELNDGRLVFIMDITVVEKYRGKGIGSFALKKFLTSGHVNEKYDTVMCWPTPELKIVSSDIERKKLKQRQVAFFQKNEFRRVGRTDIFGYSPDATHPSRSIPVAADAKEKGEEFESSDRGSSIDEIEKKYPLHAAIFNVKKVEMDVGGTIRKHYQSDPTSIHQPNSSGYTPIHAALMTINLKAVQVLLAMGVIEDLHNSRNVECRTPLEVLESVMLSSRQAAGEYWKGYSDVVLTCEFLVKRAMDESTMANTLAEYIVKRKWGCTCGVCAEGWLSERMRSNLATVIIETLDISDSVELETFRPRAQHPNSDTLMLTRDFPPELRQSVNLSFYTGCRAILEAVAQVLGETNEPLSVAAILARTPKDKSVKAFFTKGGQIKHVLDSVTIWTMFRMQNSDGAEFELWDMMKEEIGELEAICANDLDFSLVRRRLGLEVAYFLPGGGGGGGGW